MRRPVIDRGQRDRGPADPRPAVPPHQHRPARRPRAAQGRAEPRGARRRSAATSARRRPGPRTSSPSASATPPPAATDIAGYAATLAVGARRVPGRRQHRHVLRRRPGDRLPLHPRRPRRPGRHGPLPGLRQREGRREHLPVRGARRRAAVREGRGAGEGHPRAPTRRSRSQVSGQSAQLVDTKASLFGRLPLALAIIAIVTFLVLFLQFGSRGHPHQGPDPEPPQPHRHVRGDGLRVPGRAPQPTCSNFTATGQIDATTPILMFCVAFGLSMDYEVFLLSRIKEEHDRTGRQRAVGGQGPRAHRPDRHRRRRC